MPAINPRADRENVREIRSDRSLDLERYGAMSVRTVEEREAFALVADIVGDHDVAAKLRAQAARRARVAAVPDDPRPPLRSRTPAGQAPILGVLDGGGEAAERPVDERQALRWRMAHLAEEAAAAAWATDVERAEWAATARVLREPTPQPPAAC